DQAVGLFLFAKSGSHRFYSRMFAVDIPEDAATGSATGPLGGYAVRYGLVERARKISLVSEQGTRMGRQSFLHIELTYGESKDIPVKIEVGGSVMPVLRGTLSDLPA
ncbi:MAG TPA: PhzF family phenazine biosynthesis protein, partial [Candidatus Limnocylindrales bacterium]|nr:PhzF family phenazine biosynthesis protein [Candidatus Limnocylindrales bacterium]